ncbi:MAG: hypothetical protein ACOX17_06025 [Christensenellales bacterium]
MAEYPTVTTHVPEAIVYPPSTEGAEKPTTSPELVVITKNYKAKLNVPVLKENPVIRTVKRNITAKIALPLTVTLSGAAEIPTAPEEKCLETKRTDSLICLAAVAKKAADMGKKSHIVTIIHIINAPSKAGNPLKVSPLLREVNVGSIMAVSVVPSTVESIVPIMRTNMERDAPMIIDPMERNVHTEITKELDITNKMN